MRLILFLFLYLFVSNLYSQTQSSSVNRSEKVYNLEITAGTINLGGVSSHGMMVNGGIPGPNLEFNEGDMAIIHVTNKMDVPSSVHWHGLLVPNFEDGVPFMTTPPIMPNTTFTYHIPINQSGTYWYHSHTMLQEQKGVFGSIVIKPKKETLKYDKELVVIFSDWTGEKPEFILKNLKRGNDWYQVKKGTAVPLGRVFGRRAFGAQLKLWRDRMEGADIADIYYPTFLTNGKKLAEYPDFEPGERVRLRIINAASSSYFWLDFGSLSTTIVSADGIDVKPVSKSRLLLAVAETYDFIVEIPDGTAEITATSQDGSGHTSLHLGKGKIFPAKTFPRPDKIEMMQTYANMNMKMGAPSIIGNSKKKTPEWLMNKYGMHMNHDMQGSMGEMDHSQMDHSKMDHSKKDESEMDHSKMDHSKMDQSEMDHSKMDHSKMDHSKMDSSGHSMKNMEMNVKSKKENKNNNMSGMDMSGMDMSDMDMSGMDISGMDMSHSKSKIQDSLSFNFAERRTYFNYDFLEAKGKTDFSPDLPKQKILLNLTGNMNRYIWSMNGRPINETDKILIKKGELTQITLNNMTMMHHPMHLHGHFFRVINEKGERSPIKHTVNVPPMQKVTIEFVGEEYGDWFFHCHILYHMMAGMDRIVSYGTPRDSRMANFPEKMIYKEMNPSFFWGTADLNSNYSEFNLMLSNMRNEWIANLEYGYKKDLEAEISYNRYLNDWVRLYVGVNTENETEHSLDDMNTVGKIGIKYFTPYMFYIDINLDSQLRPQFKLMRELMLFYGFFINGSYEYTADFNNGEGYSKETKWRLGAEYMLSKNFSLTANYHNLYGAGGGLSIRF